MAAEVNRASENKSTGPGHVVAKDLYRAKGLTLSLGSVLHPYLPTPACIAQRTLFFLSRFGFRFQEARFHTDLASKTRENIPPR